MSEEAERVFNDIKKLLINPPVLKAPTPDRLFRLESDTSREGVGGTLLQKQGDEWVVIGYHSKRLPKSAKNFGVTELELTGLLMNIHGFMQLLHNRYFEVLFWGGISIGITSGQSTSWVSTSMHNGAGVLPSITFSADFKIGVTDPCVTGSFVL